MPKEIYVIVINDRHADIETEAYSDGLKAIGRARELATEYARDEAVDEKTLNAAMIRAGWVYHAVYSCEGDSVTVHRKQIVE